ncbi:MAG TPA: hypothetical protein PKA98_04640, partial [Acidimicrobiales bacterium]|nr:hypothetical protein [Acidimicrobiales bacterium]
MSGGDGPGTGRRSEFPGDWAGPGGDRRRERGDGQEPPPITTRQRIAPTVGLAVVAAVLTLLGHTTAAVVAAVAAVAIGLACFASDAFVRAFHRLQHRVAHGVGVGLTWVLMFPIHYLILTPAGLIARLLRADPLRPTSGG